MTKFFAGVIAGLSFMTIVAVMGLAVYSHSQQADQDSLVAQLQNAGMETCGRNGLGDMIEVGERQFQSCAYIVLMDEYVLFIIDEDGIVRRGTIPGDAI